MSDYQSYQSKWLDIKHKLSLLFRYIKQELSEIKEAWLAIRDDY